MRRLSDLTAWIGATTWTAGAAGAAAVVSWLVVAVAHLDDQYHVDHVAGAWMGLTQAADRGVLYPPLYEDGYFGGTRYMPFPIVLNTAAAKASGEYLVSGKLVGAIVVVALLLLVWQSARRLGSDRRMALASAGAVIATFTAFFAGTTMYGDALPVLLQLGAVALLVHETSRRAVILAAALAVLAVAAKLSALWGGAAVLAWLLLHERRRVPLFVLSAVAVGLATFGLAELASAGRFSDSLEALAFSGFSGFYALLVETPEKTVELLRDRATATLALLPLAVAALLVATARRRLDVVGLALVAATAVTLVVLTDVGTDFNHLLDLAVLTPLVAVGAYGRSTMPALRLGIAVAFTVAIGLSLWDLRHEVREAGSMLVHRETPERFRAPPLQVALTEPFFTEDASVAVGRGSRPVALDAFTLKRVLETHPDWERELIGRFERREFTSVILINDLDLADPWWSESHLGLDVATAIARNYRLARKLAGPVFKYRLFLPRRDGG